MYCIVCLTVFHIFLYLAIFFQVTWDLWLFAGTPAVSSTLASLLHRKTWTVGRRVQKNRLVVRTRWHDYLWLFFPVCFQYVSHINHHFWGDVLFFWGLPHIQHQQPISVWCNTKNSTSFRSLVFIQKGIVLPVNRHRHGCGIPRIPSSVDIAGATWRGRRWKCDPSHVKSTDPRTKWHKLTIELWLVLVDLFIFHPFLGWYVNM